MTQRRPKPWAEKDCHGRTRYVWRYEDRKYRTTFYDDPEEARADATTQITEQIKGSWQERSGPKMLLEEWIDLWVEMLGDIEPTTCAKYKYFVEGHILPAFDHDPRRRRPRREDRPQPRRSARAAAAGCAQKAGHRHRQHIPPPT